MLAYLASKLDVGRCDQTVFIQKCGLLGCVRAESRNDRAEVDIAFSLNKSVKNDFNSSCLI